MRAFATMKLTPETNRNNNNNPLVVNYRVRTQTSFAQMPDLTLEEAQMDAEEEFQAFGQLANCSHNLFKANLCPFHYRNDSLAYADLVELTVCVSFYVATMIIGISCNAFVLTIAVISKMNKTRRARLSMSKTSNCDADRSIVVTTRTADFQRVVLSDTLICLCTSDLIILTVCVPVRLARWFTYTWTFGEVLCKSVFFLQYWSVSGSILTIIFLALQRYHAATNPLKVHRVWSPRNVRLSLALISVVSAFLASPLLYGQAHRPIGVAGTGIHYWCITEFDDDFQLLVFEAYMYTLIVVIPVTFMIIAYACILFKMPGGWVAERSQETLGTAAEVRTPTDSRLGALQIANLAHYQRRYMRVVRLLVLSVVVFALCWTPYQTDRLLSAVGVLKQFNIGWLKKFRMAITLLAHANSCFNPLIYCFLSTNFRKSVRRILKWQTA